MSETSTPITSTEENGRHAERQRSATRQAWIVVMALTIIATLVIVDFAFSTSNDEASIDGSTATSSQYIDGGVDG